MYPTEPVPVLIMLSIENVTSKGHPETKLLPDIPSKGTEKRVAMPKIGRLRLIDHLVTIRNIVVNFCISPLACNSAIVGANMALREVK
jgi:hypothetical protein